MDTLLWRWFAWWHGIGDPEQNAIYRCQACKRLVTWRRIREGGCACGMGNKVTTTYVTRGEKLKLLVLPWTV